MLGVGLLPSKKGADVIMSNGRYSSISVLQTGSTCTTNTYIRANTP